MAKRRYVVCVKNRGYEVSLERRKLYEVLPDADAAKLGQIRVKDESGEAYLYPASFFQAVELSAPIAKKIFHAA